MIMPSLLQPLYRVVTLPRAVSYGRLDRYQGREG